MLSLCENVVRYLTQDLLAIAFWKIMQSMGEVLTKITVYYKGTRKGVKKSKNKSHALERI